MKTNFLFVYNFYGGTIELFHVETGRSEFLFVYFISISYFNFKVHSVYLPLLLWTNLKLSSQLDD